MLKPVSKHFIVGTFPRKGVKHYKIRRGFTIEWIPVAEVELFDEVKDFSYLASGRKIPLEKGESIILTEDDVIVAHDGAHTSRTKVVAGSEVKMLWVSIYSCSSHQVGIKLPA